MTELQRQLDAANTLITKYREETASLRQQLTKIEQNYEDWWRQFIVEHEEWRHADGDALRKAAFEAGAASRDAEIARLKTVPMRYRRMAFNAQLQNEVAELVAALERMRVAGGSQEFHIAWELAKDVLTKVRKP